MKLLGGIIFAASAGVVYKLDSRSGEELESYELTRELYAIYTPLTIYKSMLITVSQHHVVAIDRRKFKRIWKSNDLGDRFECLEVISNRLCVASDGEVSVLDLDTGQTVFSERFEGPRGAITLLKDDTTDPTRPVCYVGFCGKIYVIDINGHARLPMFITVSEDDTFGVSMCLFRGLLIASSEGLLCAYDTTTMEECWLCQFGPDTGYAFMNSIHPVCRDGKNIIVVGANGYVLGVDAKTGKALWITSLPRSGYNFVSTLHNNGTLYAATTGKLYGLDLFSGNILWSVGLPGMGTHSISIISPNDRNSMNSDTPILQSQGRLPSFSLFR